MNKTRVAIVGCGRIADTHVEALQAIEEAHLVAVADVNPEAAQRLGQKAGSSAYADHRALFRREEPQVVCVCTPPAFHAEVTMDALSAGAHVLCEKPFTTDLKAAEAMVETARRAGRFLTMASKFRFVDDVTRAKELIQEGVIGKVVLCEISFCARADMRGRWPSDPKVSGGGVLIDNGSHAVDIIRYLLGPIQRVQAQHGRSIQRLPVEDTSMVHVETVDGVWGRIDLSWSLEKDQQDYISIYGSDGMLKVGWAASRYRPYVSKDWTVFGRGYNKLEAFIKQYRCFLRSIQGSGKPVITAEDGYESVRVIEVAYWSARSNKWLEVEECLTPWSIPQR